MRGSVLGNSSREQPYRPRLARECSCTTADRSEWKTRIRVRCLRGLFRFIGARFWGLGQLIAGPLAIAAHTYTDSAHIRKR